MTTAATLSRAETIGILAAHGYRVSLVFGNVYRVAGHGYKNEALLARLRQMALNLENGRPINA